MFCEINAKKIILKKFKNKMGTQKLSELPMGIIRLRGRKNRRLCVSSQHNRIQNNDVCDDEYDCGDGSDSGDREEEEKEEKKKEEKEEEKKKEEEEEEKDDDDDDEKDDDDAKDDDDEKDDDDDDEDDDDDDEKDDDDAKDDDEEFMNTSQHSYFKIPNELLRFQKIIKQKNETKFLVVVNVSSKCSKRSTRRYINFHRTF